MRPNRNPFAVVRAQRIHTRAARVKQELHAGHEAGAEDYLSSTPTELLAGTKAPGELARYENLLPMKVLRDALDADLLARRFYLDNRKHRENHRRRGSHIADGDEVLARRVCQMEQQGIGRTEAMREAANYLNNEYKVAMARIRRAIKRLLG